MARAFRSTLKGFMKDMLLATVARCDRRLLDAALSNVRDVLDRIPSRAVERMADVGIRIAVLDAGERYRAASPMLVSLGIDVDAWPVPPAGLFVIGERTVYLRATNPMTIAHELGHAFDCALGGGEMYLSSYDSEIRRAYEAARDYVTPYASVGLDEFFAECFRAYVEVNDPRSLWPLVTRSRLRQLVPEMFDWLERTLALEAVA